MDAPVLSHSKKELLWLACREKTCCHTTRVIVGGRDVWRITQALATLPWEYTLYAVALDGAVDAFRLAPGGPAYQLVLAKRGKIGPQGAPCFFLWKLADGHAQCGLGTLRPAVCRAYPALLMDGMLAVESAACTCRRWSLVDLDGAPDVALVEHVLAEAAEYSEVVARWNAAVDAGGREQTFQEYCAYLLDTYAQLNVAAA